MSWGTYYKYDGYLSRISKRELESKLDELRTINNDMWGEILAYMAATPPVTMENEEGYKYPYQEFITGKWKEFKNEIEENERLISKIEDCLETLQEHPEQVKEG